MFMCFMCYDKKNHEKLKKHMTEVHSASCPMETLAEMCTEAEEKEEREGWSLDDIIMEEWDRREAEEKRRAESSGLINWLRRRQRVTKPELGNEETPSIKCFLCQGQWTGTSKEELATHLEEDHKVLFGIKEIMEQGENQEEVITETEPEIPAPKGERIDIKC